MSVGKKDALKANFVLIGVGLLNSQTEIEAFREAVDAEVLAELPVLPGLAVDAPFPDLPRRLTLNKDRITLEVSAARSVIEREYPDEDALERLSEVASVAVAMTTSSVTAQSFGFNVECVYDVDDTGSASHYIAQRLQAGHLQVTDDWSLQGGSTKLVFREGDTLWTVRLEPRFQDLSTQKLFLSLNLHRDEQGTPSQSEVTDYLHTAWATADKFIEHFDGVQH